ncbi:MAG: hypothetical protein LBD20_03790 [Spirochaetaceae bacterium]|jgi:hypothetical protein|nr:hypothetical protein [Spirochaetaceae bacterium]
MPAQSLCGLAATEGGVHNALGGYFTALLRQKNPSSKSAMEGDFGAALHGAQLERIARYFAQKLASVPIFELVIFAFGKNDGKAAMRP